MNEILGPFLQYGAIGIILAYQLVQYKFLVNNLVETNMKALETILALKDSINKLTEEIRTMKRA